MFPVTSNKPHQVQGVIIWWKGKSSNCNFKYERVGQGLGASERKQNRGTYIRASFQPQEGCGLPHSPVEGARDRSCTKGHRSHPPSRRGDRMWRNFLKQIREIRTVKSTSPLLFTLSKKEICFHQCEFTPQYSPIPGISFLF